MPRTSTDRTREFHEICSFLGAAKRAPNPASLAAAAASSKPQTPEVASLADFHTAASSISQEIFTTSQKVKILNVRGREGQGASTSPAGPRGS